MTSTDDERWRAVVGWEGLYEVSDFGRVRSVDRCYVDGAGRRRKVVGRIRALHQRREGYGQVELYRDGVGRMVCVHQLVARAFLGDRPSSAHEVCHADGDGSNNVLRNLRWDTRSANSQDSIRHGRHASARRTHCPRGHILKAPNLRRGQMKAGKRTCLACARARAHLRDHPQADVDFVADRYYTALLGETETAR